MTDTLIASYIDMIRQGHSEGKIAKYAMVELFTLEERRNSNCNGMQNKRKLDPLHLSTVRHACFKADPIALS